MPIYEYHCKRCGYKFEIRQDYNASVEMRCPNCEKKAKRVISVVNHKKVIEGM